MDYLSPLLRENQFWKQHPKDIVFLDFAVLLGKDLEVYHPNSMVDGQFMCG
jgi:hypothetical protein